MTSKLSDITSKFHTFTTFVCLAYNRKVSYRICRYAYGQYSHKNSQK